MKKIIYYTDRHDNPIKEITPENIEGFKDFIFQVFEHNENPYLTRLSIGEHKISDEVALQDFFSTRMSPELQQKMEEFLGDRLIPSCSEKHRKELFDCVENHPHLVFTAFRKADNYYSGMCRFLMEELQNRDIKDNIKLYHKMLQNYIYIKGLEHLKGHAEPIPHLSAELNKILTNWSDKEKTSKFTENYIQDLVESGVLLNCDNLPSALRKKVNQYAIKSNVPQNNWKNLHDKYMDREFLSELLKNRRIPSLIGTTENTTGDLPKYYTSVRNALMKEIEKAPKYDESNYGKQITQNKRFGMVINELMGENYKIKPNSILFDIYIQTAQIDIINGQANDLPDQAILLVLLTDKNNYYIRKIPEDLLSKKNIKIPSKAKQIRKISQLQKMSPQEIIDFANEVSDSKILNRAEKDKVVTALDKAIENQMSQPDTALLNRMLEAKNAIIQRKQQMQNLAKENLSIDDEKLEDANLLSDEEKHKARTLNAVKNKDKLAEKEKLAQSRKNALSVARAKKLENLKYQR